MAIGVEYLEGRRLNSITFVEDYVQFTFDGPWLTLYHWPKVSSDTDSYKLGVPGYRDALCEQIGKIVKATSVVTNEALKLEFVDGIIFESSLRDEDCVGPEAGLFSTGGSDDPLMVF